MYERTTAVFNGTTITAPDANSTFTNPGAPIYVVQVSRGDMLDKIEVDCYGPARPSTSCK